MARYSFRRAFRVEPYGCHVYFFVDRENWARFIGRRKLGTYAERRNEAADMDGASVGNATELFLGVFDGKHGTLAHEAVHTAMSILGRASVRVTPNNDEALAHLVDFIVDKCAGSL